MLDWQGILPHLEELRGRFLKCLGLFGLVFVIGYIFSDHIFQGLVKPLALAYEGNAASRRLIYTGVTEVFTTYIRTAAFCALCVTLPYVATHVWFFVTPGLYQHERKIFRICAFLTPFLFWFGILFSYFWVLPIACRFFVSFEVPSHFGNMAIHMEPRVHEYLSFVINLSLAFGICFQLPALLVIFVKSGLLSKESIVKQWRIFVAVITALAAIITPPDIVSMLALILPLLTLYGLSIMVLHFISR